MKPIYTPTNHKLIILYRDPELHRDSISFCLVDHAGQVERSTNMPHIFNSILEEMLSIIEKTPQYSYEIQVPYPSKAELSKKQIGILEFIVSLYNTDEERVKTQLKEMVRKVIAESKKTQEGYKALFNKLGKPVCGFHNK